MNERIAPIIAPSTPSKDLLVFDNPNPQRDYLIRFDVPEFTCNCPLTGQPDFARFEIHIVPDLKCVELKALKMYFWSYRNEGAFHEKVTGTILEDIVRAIAPRFLRLDAFWNVRGGITTRLVMIHKAEGWLDEFDLACCPTGHTVCGG